MPDLDTATATAAPVAVAAPTPSGGIRRVNGRLMMTLDVTALHAYLRALNVEVQGASFVSPPPPTVGSRSATIDPNSNALQPAALCSINYKATASGGRPRVGTDPLILEWDLAAVYATPPTTAGLKALGLSVERARDLVIAHYAPVEISIVVSPLKRAEMIAAHAPAPATVAPSRRAAPAPEDDSDDDHDSDSDEEA